MPAKTQQQQKFFGMVYRHKKEGGKAPSSAVAKAAKSMSLKQTRDFAKTKRKDLPRKVESLLKSVSLNEATAPRKHELWNCFSAECAGRTQRHELLQDGSWRCLTCGRVKRKKLLKAPMTPTPQFTEYLDNVLRR